MLRTHLLAVLRDVALITATHYLSEQRIAYRSSHQDAQSTSASDEWRRTCRLGRQNMQLHDDGHISNWNYVFVLKKVQEMELSFYAQAQRIYMKYLAA